LEIWSVGGLLIGATDRWRATGPEIRADVTATDTVLALTVGAELLLALDGLDDPGGHSGRSGGAARNGGPAPADRAADTYWMRVGLLSSSGGRGPGEPVTLRLELRALLIEGPPVIRPPSGPRPTA
jgi:hypothetical protein